MKVAGSYRSMQHLRELSGLLAVALLSSLLAVFPASNDPAVGDYTSYNEFQGDQTIVYNDLACDLGDPAVHTTAETAFEISTSAQLWEVTDCVSTSSTIFFELAGDIDLAEASSNANLDTSSPIGFNGSNPLAPISFSGVLNGNDKTIKNIAMSIEGIGVGLFAVLESATISNLVISGSFEALTLQEDAVEDSAGALAIYASGIVNLYSVSNQANVTGRDNVGGLIGWTDGSVNITNTHNSGAISGSDWVGGIVGYVSKGASFSSSQNSGTVSATGAYVGGLAGLIAEESGTGNFLNSSNTGAISGSDWVGGIVGDARPGLFSSSQNSGTVSATGRFVGGLAGGFSGTIYSSFNSGKVSGNDEVGGLVGRFSGTVRISSSYNTGEVQSENESAGGLIGETPGSIFLNAVTNSGTVSGNGNYVGGLVGFVDEDVFIDASSNTGSVNNPSQYTGGLVGYINAGSAYISSSNNTGAISGSRYVGGLLGFMYDEDEFPIYISDSFNSGTVSGTSYSVGGLVGEQEGGPVFVNSSFNRGSVNGTYDTGGFVGDSGTDAIFTNSQNFGKISGSHRVAGLVGSVNAANFENTINTGDIRATGEAGGLIGDLRNGSIRYSHNTGDVSSSRGDVGGVIGYCSRDVEIMNSFNSGDVSNMGGADVAGGLVGDCDTLTVSDSYNSGAVSASSYAGGLAGHTDTFHIVRSGNKGSVSGQGAVGGLVGLNDGGDSTFSMVGNFASVSGTLDTGGLFGSSGECAACDIYIDNFVNAGNVIGSNDPNTRTAGIIGFLSGTVSALIGYNSGLVQGFFTDPLAGNLGGVSEDTIGLFTTADSFLLSATPVSSLQSEAAFNANAWGSSLTSNWGFGSCDFNQGLPIPRVFGSILGVTEFSATGCIPVVIQDSSNASPPSSTPSYAGPTLTANNQSVVAGSSVVFSGTKLDLVTAVYVGESLVEITSKTAASITVRLPATLAAGSYDLMMYSSYGRLAVMGAVVVSTASITDSSNSSIVDLEDLGSKLNLSDAAKLLIGKTKNIPNFAKDQNSLSTKQSAWLKESLEDSGLTKIVCTGVIMESMSMHQKIQVRKLSKATCVEAAKFLGESSVWYQSKLTTKAAYVRKVMVTFKG